jgi:hypothetical protein
MIIFFLAGTFFKINFFKDFSKMMVFICLIQPIPFITSDGYWILSDLSGVTNLLEKSTAKMNTFLKNPVSFFKKNTTKDLFMLSYGVFNLFFVVSFAYYQLTYNFDALIHFPIYIKELAQQAINDYWTKITFDAQYISVILFYYIIYSYLKL